MIVDKEIVSKATKVATLAHYGQFRKNSPLPYIVHCNEVMKEITEYDYELDHTAEEYTTLLAAAVLHDTIEDTYITKSKLQEEFGERIANLVEECSRQSDHTSNEQKLNFLKSFKNKSTDSIIIKIADRFCNTVDYYYADLKEYASWYALQAYPLYQEIENRHLNQIIRRNIKITIGSLKNIIKENYDIDNFWFNAKAVDDFLCQKKEIK